VQTWPRPEARTAPDRQYVYQPGRAVNGGTVVIGYPYSLLAWIPSRSQSWALSIDTERVPSTQTDLEVGVEQVKRLGQARQSLPEVLDIVAADAKYGNHKFFRPLRGQHCGVVAAMRADRVLYCFSCKKSLAHGKLRARPLVFVRAQGGVTFPTKRRWLAEPCPAGARATGSG